MSSTVDLSTLPPPSVVQELDFEQLLAELRADLLQRYPESADVLDLESEPLVKLLQAFAYREMLFRQRVNEAARSNLLAFANKSDLDHKGAFYNLPRLPGESDDRYRVRIQLRIAALAGNGTGEQYQLLAMTASPNVRSSAVGPSLPGTVELVLWLIDFDQAESTLAAVTAALNAENARPLGIPVTVSLAQPRAVNVAARLWREASAPVDLVQQLAAALPAALASYAALGRDLPRSWITARLHVAGIARVQFLGEDSPPENTPLQSNEYPTLGSLQLLDQGVL
ncbi:MAG: baseplate J protein [Roseateles depolymerans]|uniref:Baseplate J protein n=1 Tax=Roseateles depolymerans TaxID=76731 RepID=A0A2W5DEV8_9BURK|nr:MAG: baseplate J protein [Roseateles depolymerans]